MSTDYFIGVHDLEIDRLKLQHEAWCSETEALWNRAGFKNLSNIIDLGCGPGFTTIDLANKIAPSANVCGLDKATAFLDYLKKYTEEHRIRNICSATTDLTLPQLFKQEFDGAFCRWFLAFLIEDLDTVIQNIYQALKPGGVFAAMEYFNVRSTISSPRSAAFDAHTEAWIEFYKKNGGDTTIGTFLPEKLVKVGFKIQSIECTGSIARPLDQRWNWWGRLMQDFGEKFIAEGLLTQDQLKSCQKDWKALSANPNAFIYTPLMVQIVAVKPI